MNSEDFKEVENSSGRSKWILFLIGAIVLVVLLVGAYFIFQGFPKSSNSTLSGKMIAKFSGEYGIEGNFLINPNMEKAYVQLRTREYPYTEVIVDDCKVCDKVDKITKLRFSEEGNSWIAVGIKSGEEYIIFNDKLYGPYSKVDYEFTEPLISKDGKNFAYSVITEDSIYVYLNGEEYAVHDKREDPYPHVGGLTFSPDGSRLAYEVTFPNKKESFAVIDGKEQDTVFSISFITFSPDSKHIAYFEEKQFSGRNSYVVFDGQKQKSYSKIEDNLLDNLGNPIFFSPDSSKLVYIGVDMDQNLEETSYLVINGEETRSFERISLIEFSSNNKIAYVAQTSPAELDIVEEGGTWRSTQVGNTKESLYVENELIDEVEVMSLFGITEFVFDESGKKYGYVVAPNRQENYAVINGKKGPIYTYISNIKFSRDGTRYAYYAMKDNEVYIIIDGEEHKAYYPTRPFVFSRDSNHIAYWAGTFNSNDIEQGKIGQSYVVLDGNSKESYDDLFPLITEAYGMGHPLYTQNLKFTDDNKYLKYNARIGNELWLMVEPIK
ncbi:MAG: hypothetical protein Q7S56_02880 [Nanoarchaeota archaeon]|nr:hypothetical protein [Nanoarchaeota archaeon]